MGLVDVNTLKQQYDEKKEHDETHKEPSSSPQGGIKEVGSRINKNTITTVLNAGIEQNDVKSVTSAKNKVSSYRSHNPMPLAAKAVEA